MNNGLRVLLACFLGGMIGAFVALEQGFHLWLGIPVGSLTGYLAYNLREVASAASVAWRKARGWRPDTEWWRVSFRVVRHAVGFGITTGIGVGLVVNIMVSLAYLPARTISLTEALTGAWITAITGIVMGAIMALAGISETCERRSAEEIRELFDRRLNDKFWRTISNPAKVYLWYVPKWTLTGVAIVIWGLLGIIVLAVKHAPGLLGRVPSAIFCLGRFTKHVFVLVYSDERLVSLIGAGIGTVAGYLVQNALLGGLAGAAVGWASHQLVTMKLHLVRRSG